MSSYLEAYRAARTNANPSPDASPGPASPPPIARKGAANDGTTIPTSTPPPPPAPIAFLINNSEGKQTSPKTPTKPSRTPQQAKASPTKKAAGNDGTKEKLDIARQKGLYDTKPLRTKVAKWQALDESVLPDAAAEGHGATAGDGEGDHAAAGLSKSPAGAAVGTQANKISTAPKQRLVSDEHWKRNRASLKDSPEQPLETKIQNLIIERGLYVPAGAKNPEGWVRKRQLPPVKKPTESPKKEQVITPASKNVKKRINDWQGNVEGDAAPPEAIPVHDYKEEGLPIASPNLHEKAGALGDAKQKAAKSPKRPPNITITKDGQLGRVRRKTIPNPVSPSPEVNDEQASPGLSHPMINRMQNWLLQTEDPFVESPDDSFDSDEHPPTRFRHHHEFGSMMAPRQTGVRDRHQRDTRRPRARRKSTDEIMVSPSQTDDDANSNSSLGLKRSGARRRQLSPGAKPRSAPATPTGSELRLADRVADRGDEQALAVQLAPVNAHRVRSHEKQVQLHSEQQRPGLRRKLTDHDDLISVLSMSNNDQRPLKPSKSSRSGHDPSPNVSIRDALEDFRSAEKDYLEDLKTLVDGVIPVLLNHAMSRSDGAKGKLSDQTSKTLTSAREAIVELGIVLERLLSTHRRAPLATMAELQFFASRSHQIYSDYLCAWRLGFENVVVNLAPADAPGQGTILGEVGSAKALDSGARKASVPSLLKRPLARIKHIAKVLKVSKHFRMAGEVQVP